MFSVLCLPWTTCRYVRRQEEDHDIGFEDVDFVVNSIVELADVLKDL
jgi:hypothetical protein